MIELLNPADSVPILAGMCSGIAVVKVWAFAKRLVG